MDLLKETILAGRRTMCPGCPSCEAFAATSEFALLDIARFVTYYEQDGHDRGARILPGPAGIRPRRRRGGPGRVARRLPFHVDYPEIIRRAERYFA